jgi:pyruvate,water dikinase
MQMFDVVRAAARVIGTQLATDGQLDSADDVFYLTLAELRGRLPADCAGTVRERRALRQRYLELELPLDWIGMPVPTRSAQATPATISDISRIDALGVSAGKVEGIAKVVIDPNDSEAFEPGDILICHTTDPSWSSHFFIAAAVVIDIGGALSHGAIVARELGIPCVINTQVGTRAIRSGDRIAVDGDSGTVDILVRASAAP